MQLEALIGGTTLDLGSPYVITGNYAVPPTFVVARPPASSPGGSGRFAAALAYDDGIHVFVANAQGAVTDIPIPSTPVASDANCEVPEFGSSGCTVMTVGVMFRAMALAWTDDGTLWLAYVESSLDETFGQKYTPGEDGPGTRYVTSDMSTHTIHLLKLSMDGSAPQDLLSVPTDRPADLDMNSAGTDLAIAIGTYVHPLSGDGATRVLRVDTTKL